MVDFNVPAFSAVKLNRLPRQYPSAYTEAGIADRLLAVQISLESIAQTNARQETVLNTLSESFSRSAPNYSEPECVDISTPAKTAYRDALRGPIQTVPKQNGFPPIPSVPQNVGTTKPVADKVPQQAASQTVSASESPRRRTYRSLPDLTDLGDVNDEESKRNPLLDDNGFQFQRNQRLKQQRSQKVISPPPPPPAPKPTKPAGRNFNNRKPAIVGKNCS